jgi:hypothetical protein
MKFKLKGSEFFDFVVRSACVEQRILDFVIQYGYSIHPELGGRRYFF